jgi:hypothetical protein
VLELEKAAKVAASELEKANKELVEVRLAAGEGEKSRAAAAALGAELGELKGKFAEVELRLVNGNSCFFIQFTKCTLKGGFLKFAMPFGE